MHPKEHCKGEKDISVKSHIGLLPDGHEARVSGKQIPEAGKRHKEKHLTQETEIRAPGPPRGGEERNQDEQPDQRGHAAGA